MSAPRISPVNVRMDPNSKPKESMLSAVIKKLGIKPIAPIAKFNRSNKINSLAVLSTGINCIDSFTGYIAPIVCFFYGRLTAFAKMFVNM